MIVGAPRPQDFSKIKLVGELVVFPRNNSTITIAIAIVETNVNIKKSRKKGLYLTFTSNYIH